jgi:hypothetical protein
VPEQSRAVLLLSLAMLCVIVFASTQQLAGGTVNVT